MFGRPLLKETHRNPMVWSLVMPLICQKSGIVLFINDSEDQIMATKKKAPAKKAPAKKAAAKKAPAKKAAPKKKAPAKKAAAPAVKRQPAVKTKMTKTAILNEIATNTNLTRTQVGAVMDELESVIERHVRKRSVGEFTLPGLLKIKAAKRPATKKRMGRNPATGEEIVIPAKPATTRVRVTALKKLKDMIL
jgi:nucleoid DNA-binding protein